MVKKKKPKKWVSLTFRVQPEIAKKLKIMAAQEEQKQLAMIEILIEEGWEKYSPAYR